MAEDRELRTHLRSFVDEHPDGWNHEEWRAFLDDLQSKGFDTSDTDRIGSALERERLEAALAGSGISGLGPRRREALVERYRTLWNLRQASAEDIAGIPSIHRSMAQQIAERLR